MQTWQEFLASADNPVARLGSLTKARTKDIKAAVQAVRKWMRSQPPPPPMSWSDGWGQLTPEQALLFLRHTEAAKGNRRTSPSTILKYGQAITAGDWRETGEAIKRDDKGYPLDGQHRAWAVLFSGIAIATYFISSIKPQENLFAYLDNSKARTNTDALETAGLNGNSSLINETIALLRQYEHNALNYKTASGNRVTALQPPEIIRFNHARPTVRAAITVLARDHKDMQRLFQNGVGGVTAVKIFEHYGEDTLHNFLAGLESADIMVPNRTNNPLVALKHKLDGFKAENPQQSKAVQLAAVIVGFNAWRLERKMKQLVVDVTKPYPRFDIPPPAEDDDEEVAA